MSYEPDGQIDRKISSLGVFGGAALAAGITGGELFAQEMIGTDSLAGILIALFTWFGYWRLLVGRLSQRFGRHWGLTTGFLQ
ncbi:hypothetical protein PDUR_02565 [Paenibacillus durus]|uniref:Uncharacterized protein n=1 Tax=Paenibacillus durus TaxID=44251 RepID=A0A089HGE1_PAEDU|nr:hypothetical protein PDUR_02565 [Paenibacillus durus]